MEQLDSNAIKDVFAGLMGSIEREKHESAALLMQMPTINGYSESLKKGDLDVFGLFFAGKLNEAVEGVAELALKDPMAVFIAVNHRFVSAHIGKLIENTEGWPCSADKEGTIIRAAFNWYEHKKPISFNYDGEYTYHLPKKVLTTQERIIAYMDGLYHLYHGQPVQYLQALKTEMDLGEAA